MIYRISQEDLEKPKLHTRIYPDLEQTFYWTESWDPEFYIALARAGFISIARQDPKLGFLLLPEIQQSYAVLDWENLRCSRSLGKLMQSGRLAEEEIELRVADPCERVLARLVAYHGADSWILGPYQALIAELPTEANGRFAIHGLELWSRKRNELVAGELGYSIGRTYTSLSGFFTRENEEWRGFGTLQLYLLAERLRDAGYAFWNMGHPHMPYKTELGARDAARPEFLKRWFAERDTEPVHGLHAEAESPKA